jgi:hypothetical protein
MIQVIIIQFINLFLFLFNFVDNKNNYYLEKIRSEQSNRIGNYIASNDFLSLPEDQKDKIRKLFFEKIGITGL